MFPSVRVEHRCPCGILNRHVVMRAVHAFQEHASSLRPVAGILFIIVENADVALANMPKQFGIF
jgi:hypothetical protein